MAAQGLWATCTGLEVIANFIFKFQRLLQKFQSKEDQFWPFFQFNAENTPFVGFLAQKIAAQGHRAMSYGMKITRNYIH